MKKYIRYVRLISLLAALGLMLLPATAYAVQPADPDDISIRSVGVYQNIFETGDMLFVISCDIEYTVEPAGNASSNFLFSLYNASNSTLISPVRPVSYYQESVTSIYRTAAQVTSSGLVWGSNYRVRVGGNPTVFGNLTEGISMTTRTLSSSDWVVGNAATSREALRVWCLAQAAWMQTERGVALLVSVPDVLYALNTLGRIMFLEGIPNLDSVVPLLFQASVGTNEYEDDEVTGAYEEETSVSNRLGDAVADSFEGIGDYFGVSGQTTAGMFWALIMVIAASIVFAYSGNTVAAILLCAPLLILGAELGLVPLAMLFVLTIAMVAYLGYQLYLVRM